MSLKINFTKNGTCLCQPTLCNDPSQSIFIWWILLTWCYICKGGLKNYLQKMASTPTTYALILKGFTYFVKSWGPFFDTLAMDLYLLPHEWWNLVKVNGCTFAPIVHCIMAQVCSTSLCEQNWSSYSFVHSKVQIG
jgi:hypothetical protein